MANKMVKSKLGTLLQKKISIVYVYFKTKSIISLDSAVRGCGFQLLIDDP